jgi:molybdate transport system ATP-binding protein
MGKSDKKHWGILITNQSKKDALLKDLMSPARMNPPGLESLVGKKAALFSKLEVDRLIDEEVRHDKKLLTADTDQSLQSFSSGERKRALFKYLRQSNY